MLYRKKPVVIEAVQWNGTMADVIALVGHDLPTYGRQGQDRSLRVSVSAGDFECRLGDWIIKDSQGGLHVCNPRAFAATYEAVEE